MSELGQLERELACVDRLIETAAVEGDAGEFVRLRMREAALPRLIREARARPVIEEIDRLERLRAEIEAEVKRMREGPPPTVPPAQRGHVTSMMLQNARLAGAWERARAVGKEIKVRRSLLAEIEAEGPRP